MLEDQRSERIDGVAESQREKERGKNKKIKKEKNYRHLQDLNPNDCEQGIIKWVLDIAYCAPCSELVFNPSNPDSPQTDRKKLILQNKF